VWTRRDRGLPPPELTKRLAEIKPNAAHMAIVELERMGKCDFVISQNVDNLHLESGFPFVKLAELHGNKARVRCQECQKTVDVNALAAMPRRRKTRKNRHLSYECPSCGGPLVRSVVNFGDLLPELDVKASHQWAERADVFVVVGSSCIVTPAANIPRQAKRCGSKLAVMNIGETGVDDICDLRFRHEMVGQLLPALFVRVRSAASASYTGRRGGETEIP
jgi:NAD-dependent deacetylase